MHHLLARRWMSTAVSPAPRMGFKQAASGLWQLCQNSWKSFQLGREARRRPLTGPELRFRMQLWEDISSIKYHLLVFLIPGVGYLAPLHLLFFPHKAPLTMRGPEAVAHHRTVRRAQREAHGAALRHFLYLAADDYAKRPQPPLIDNKFFKPEFAHKNPEAAKYLKQSIAMNTTDSKPPKSMLQEMTEQKRNQQEIQKLFRVRSPSANEIDPTDPKFDLKAYQKREQRTLMEVTTISLFVMCVLLV
jgi:hypothetical protein